MPPFLQGLNYGIKLFIICGVISLSLIQPLTEICNMPIILAQNCSNFHSTHITPYLKFLPEIWQDENWSFCYLLLQYIENFLSFFYLFKRLVSFLHCIHHLSTNPTKISDGLPIKTCQSMEDSYLKDIPP